MYSRVQLQVVALLLKEQVAMTTDQLWQRLQCDRRTLTSAISMLRRYQVLHVQVWVRHASPGKKAYPRELWALGPGVDAKKPKPIPSSELKRQKRIK